MFKKLTGALVITLGFVGALILGTDEIHAKTTEDFEIVVSNVGDGQEYAYKITEINETSISGIALNKKSKTNCGIFLYKDEVGFDVKVGDKIIVIWGEEEDRFELIDRAVEIEKGKYVSETKFIINKLFDRLNK